jgi:hypothetical protein
MSAAAVSISTIALGIAIILFSVAVTLGIYYLVSGDWLWDRDKPDRDHHNWTPR